MGDEITDFISNNAGVLTDPRRQQDREPLRDLRADFQLSPCPTSPARCRGPPTRSASRSTWTRGVRGAVDDASLWRLQHRHAEQKVKPLLQDYARTGVVPVAAVRVRTKDHYRLIFFSNGRPELLRFGKKPSSPKIAEICRSIGARPSPASALSRITGERVFFGSDDGFVYEAEKGYSFDGAQSPIRCACRSTTRAPQTLKRWHKVTSPSVRRSRGDDLGCADFDYGDPFEAGATRRTAVAQVFTVTGGGGIWDISNWNQFYWSGATEGLMEAHLDGVGRNMSLLIAGSTSDEPPHLLQGLTLFFTVRGLQR
jgi:hypothetical protein